jgi:hypothetical protein
VSAGDVLAIDLDHPGSFRRAATTADSGVVGIVSTVPGVVLGGSVQQVAATDADLRSELEAARRAGDSEDEARIWRALDRRFMETHAAVALAGTAPCNVDAGYGAIRPGDLLQASPTPGHAMRATEAVPGTILGKALEGFEAGTGQIRVLVAPPAH